VYFCFILKDIFIPCVNQSVFVLRILLYLIRKLATKIFIELYKNELQHIIATTFVVFHFYKKLKIHDCFNFIVVFCFKGVMVFPA
jgi:hypothetical protein